MTETFVTPTVPMLADGLEKIVTDIEATALTVSALFSMIDVLASTIDNPKRRDLCATMVVEARELAKALREELGAVNAQTQKLTCIANGEWREAAE